MYRTLVILCWVLINFCHGTQGAGIWLKYAKNEENATLVPEPGSITIEYNDGDRVELVCSSTNEAMQNDKGPYLSWIEGATTTHLSQKVSIAQEKLLHTNDDGSELMCNAESLDGKKKWSISISFVLIKSNLFAILLMALGGLILTAIVAIITYEVIHRCKDRKRTIKCGTKDAPLEDEVIHKKQEQFDTPNQDTVEIGIDNLSCIHENIPSYVKFDSPDSHDAINASHENDSQDNDLIKNAVKNYDRNQNSVRVSRNRYSSSDC